MTDLSPDLPRDPRHDPVLREEVIAALAIAPGERHVDATFGAGGYTRAMLAAGAEVIACDRDPDAIAEGQALVAEADGKLMLIHGRFGEIDRLLAERGIDAVDGITFDIGVSSMQLDRDARGFSFQKDGPLDMRMAQEGETAAEWLNRADEAEIADVLYHYGDERQSRRVARAIVAARPLSRTGEVLEAIPGMAVTQHSGEGKGFHCCDRHFGAEPLEAGAATSRFAEWDAVAQGRGVADPPQAATRRAPQSSMSARMLVAHASASRASSAEGAAESPPAPSTGRKVWAASSKRCTLATCTASCELTRL